MTKTVDITALSVPLAELIALALAGTEVVFAADETPLLRLTRIEPQVTPRIPGLHPGNVWTSDDFDAPLPDQFWLGEE